MRHTSAPSYATAPLLPHKHSHNKCCVIHFLNRFAAGVGIIAPDRHAPTPSVVVWSLGLFPPDSVLAALLPHLMPACLVAPEAARTSLDASSRGTLKEVCWVRTASVCCLPCINASPAADCASQPHERKRCFRDCRVLTNVDRRISSICSRTAAAHHTEGEAHCCSTHPLLNPCSPAINRGCVTPLSASCVNGRHLSSFCALGMCRLVGLLLCRLCLWCLYFLCCCRRYL